MPFIDSFAQLGLPKPEEMPEILSLTGDFAFPDDLNCCHKLLDSHVEAGNGDRIAIRTFLQNWTYLELFEKANQIAHVLVKSGLESGNRVLIRSANNPMFVASWFGILKAGGIVVATMPLLRSKELEIICESAQISFAICQHGLLEELQNAATGLKTLLSFDSHDANLEPIMSGQPTTFQNFESKATDIALIGFTSGTTGKPKMTAHYHRDVLLICEAFPKFALSPEPMDIFTGSPPMGFTFGLGGLVLFPFYYGASTFLIEKPTPELLLKAISEYKITICFTAPTAWRVLATLVKSFDVSSLRKCISAGETLPLKIWNDWFEATGLKIIDGIGSTELLHIFIASNGENLKPGSTGIPVTGYQAQIVNDRGEKIPFNEPGFLAVKGITGCKYLNAPLKQQEYVKDGWNLTGDIFRQDQDGFFWFVARGDDMIISSGYNISAIEVENTLLEHPQIAECAVVGIHSEERGMLVCANIVLIDPESGNPDLVIEIQNWFKQRAAPYKYPRKILFLNSLPKTETGKIQRFKLK